MICITGDLHADITRFKHKNIRKLKKNDYLIICGDFGCIWEGSARERRLIKKLGKLKYHVLFVEGCHENYDLLNEYEETDWNGGRVRIISGRLMQLRRGYVYTLGDRKIFAFGGGQSDDLDIRRGAGTWWEGENPSEEDLKRAEQILTKNGHVVDYIITHEAPFTVKEFLQKDPGQKTELNSYFDRLKDSCRFKRWFFGKYHANKLISSQYHALFDDVIVIN